MNNELSVDSFFLDVEQKDDVQRMAALGYTPKEIALFVGVDPEEFYEDACIPGTSVNTLIKQGVLVTRAAPEIELHKLAESGNIDAIKQLESVNERRSFEKIILDIDEDELG